jgi:hypothetical protein
MKPSSDKAIVRNTRDMVHLSVLVTGAGTTPSSLEARMYPSICSFHAPGVAIAKGSV